MEVHFSPDVEARLLQVASASGKTVEQLVQDTVRHMLENRARFVAGVERSIEQADRGDLIEHQAVVDRIGQALPIVKRIRWTPEASDQLTVSIEHILQDDPVAARRVAENVLERINRLTKFSELGRRGEVTGTRERIIPPYVIVYRTIDDIVEILYVWHGAQDWR